MSTRPGRQMGMQMVHRRDDEDGHRWIVQDNCGDKYHLQYSGLQYKEDEYYDIDIKSEEFHCGECEP